MVQSVPLPVPLAANRGVCHSSIALLALVFVLRLLTERQPGEKCKGAALVVRSMMIVLVLVIVIVIVVRSMMIVMPVVRSMVIAFSPVHAPA
jgi:hypothetical protein